MALHDKKYGWLAAFPRPTHPACIGGEPNEAEPAFLVRGNDKLGLGVVNAYRAAAEAAGCSPDFLAQIDLAADAFAAWAASHETKTPD